MGNNLHLWPACRRASLSSYGWRRDLQWRSMVAGCHHQPRKNIRQHSLRHSRNWSQFGWMWHCQQCHRSKLASSCFTKNWRWQLFYPQCRTVKHQVFHKKLKDASFGDCFFGQMALPVLYLNTWEPFRNWGTSLSSFSSLFKFWGPSPVNFLVESFHNLFVQLSPSVGL